MCDSRVRTSGPCLPSGRSAASTSKNASDAEPHHLAGHPGRDRVGVLADEDDVDVADVVQFARTAFAHRDDGQPRRLAVVAAHRPVATSSAAASAASARSDRWAPTVGNGSTGSFSTVGATSRPPAPSTGSGTASRTSAHVCRQLASSADSTNSPAARRPTAAPPRRPADATTADWQQGDRPVPATIPAARTAGPAASGP